MIKKVYALLLMASSVTLASAQNLYFQKEGTYSSGIYEDGGTEICAYDPESGRIFSTNGAENTLDIIDASDLRNLTLIRQVDLSSYDFGINSVAVKNGYIAAVGETDSDPQSNGKVLFLDTAGTVLKELELGAMPDMAIIQNTASGLKLFTANEGEPNDDYTSDPNGSVSIVDLSSAPANLVQSDVTTLDFTVLNGTSIDPAINIYGNDGQQTIAQDLEPEYIAVRENGSKAYITLQENNAFMIIDIATASIDTVVGLGFIDRSLAGNGLDASNESAAVNIATYDHLYGMHQPDAIYSFEINGQTYIFSANEGDARDYDTYSEEERIKDVTLDPTVFPNATELQNDTVLGRLHITTSLGDNDNDGDYDALYNFGGRSFSVWNDAGQLVWDSGDEFEQYLAGAYPDEFNSNNDDNDSYKSRSDDKGPEPEAIAVGEVDGIPYAFIGLERMGGIMIYDISDPTQPEFVLYELNRDFTKAEDDPDAGDLGPEGIIFVPAEQSPEGRALIMVSNEISGTITVYAVGEALGRLENPVSDIILYPNPTDGLINISNKGNYSVYDAGGKLVKEVSDKNVIDLTDQSGGLYFIRDEKGNLSRIIRK